MSTCSVSPDTSSPEHTRRKSKSRWYPNGSGTSNGSWPGPAGSPAAGPPAAATPPGCTTFPFTSLGGDQTQIGQRRDNPTAIGQNNQRRLSRAILSGCEQKSEKFYNSWNSELCV